MDWSIYSNYRLIYKLDGVHRLIHSWDRRTVDVHGNSGDSQRSFANWGKKINSVAFFSCSLFGSVCSLRAGTVGGAWGDRVWRYVAGLGPFGRLRPLSSQH